MLEGEKGWTELSAPTALEEAIFYPEHKNMKMDFAKAFNRNHVPDMSSQPTLQQQVLLAKTPLHVADPVLDPALRTDVITLRVIAAFAKSNNFPSQVSYQSHIALHLRDH